MERADGFVGKGFTRRPTKECYPYIVVSFLSSLPMCVRTQIGKDYDVLELLGSGNFASVKLGVRKTTGERVAIKIINKQVRLRSPAAGFFFLGGGGGGGGGASKAWS